VATSYPWRTDVAQDGIVGRAARAIGSVMGPIQAATGVAPNGEMAAHPAIGAARGVTAAIRRSMEGTQTGSGTRLRFKALTQTAKNASPTPLANRPAHSGLGSARGETAGTWTGRPAKPNNSPQRLARVPKYAHSLNSERLSAASPQGSCPRGLVKSAITQIKRIRLRHREYPLSEVNPHHALKSFLLT
jgi:hypothetical protein